MINLSADDGHVHFHLVNGDHEVVRRELFQIFTNTDKLIQAKMSEFDLFWFRRAVHAYLDHPECYQCWEMHENEENKT